MELIVRGLMALALMDCPEADMCPNGAAILIPDTSYFEKLGLHQHSAVLSIPLSWIDPDHSSGGGYEVVDSGPEPMALFVLAPGQHLVVGKPEELAVKPRRDEPADSRSDAANFPLAQLLHADELVERPELDMSSIRNVIWIRSGSITTRQLFGAELEGTSRLADLSFRAPGAFRFRPRPLATEVVVELPSQGLVLQELSPPGADLRTWRLKAPVTKPPADSSQVAILSHLPLHPLSAPAAHLIALHRLVLNREAVHQALTGDFFLEPSNLTLKALWTRCGPCPACVPFDIKNCPLIVTRGEPLAAMLRGLCKDMPKESQQLCGTPDPPRE